MLTSALRVLINNPLYKSFDTIFMRNGKKKKNCQNINCFSFSTWNDKVVRLMTCFSTKKS